MTKALPVTDPKNVGISYVDILKFVDDNALD